MNDHPTRRRVLAAGSAGLAALAGCNRFAAGDDARTSGVSPAVRREVAALGTPSIPFRFPVPVGEAYLSAQRNRARTLLATVPTSPDVPNEAVRDELLDRRESAVEALQRAADADPPYDRMKSLRWARARARNAHATMAAIRGETTREAVLERRAEVRDGLRRFSERWRAVGDRAERAVVVHGELESLVRRVRDRLDDAPDVRGRYGTGALAVGEVAEAVEAAAATLSDARHLYRRHRGRLPHERAFGEAFGRTASALVASVEERFEGRKPFPGETPAEVGHELRGTPAAELSRDAPHRTRWYVERARGAFDGGRRATAVLAAGRADRGVRALKTVRDAVAGGDYASPATATTLREAKLDVLAAVERARTATDSPVANGWLRSVVSGVDSADGRLTDESLADDVGNEAVASYVWGAVRAERTADALAWTTGTLAAAVGE